MTEILLQKEYSYRDMTEHEGKSKTEQGHFIHY